MVMRMLFLALVAVMATAVIGCDPPPTCATNMPARLTDVGTAPTNVFRMAIGGSPTLASNSAAIISRQVNSGYYTGANTEVQFSFNEWKAPVYYTDSAQTKNAWPTLQWDGGPSNGRTACGPMRWKGCITGGQSDDGPAYVVDTVDRCFYEFWGLNRNTLLADPEAWWCGALPLDDATQMWEPYEGVGATAGMHLGYSSVVWPDEVTTSINHAIAVSTDKRLNSSLGVVWPAWHGDGLGTHADDLYQGMRLQLNPDFPTTGMTTYQQAVTQALKNYGMYVMDSTYNMWWVGGINPQGYTNNCWGGVLPQSVIDAKQFYSGIPLSQFRVLSYPSVYTQHHTAPVVNNSCITYLPTPGTAPTISTVSPTSGSSGTAVSLTGTNMSNPYSVRFGDTEATNVNAVSSTLVTCMVPAGSGTVKVSYRTTGGASNLKDFTYSGGGSVPTLSSINPTSGTTAGGTVCTLTGANLTGTTGVSFGGTAGTSIVNVSSTSVRATSPAKSAGAISVTATTSYGTSNGVSYTYVAPPSPPTLSAIAPTSGTTAGGTACTLTGTNLTGCSAVAFGANAATGIVVDSATQVRCASPAGSAGAVNVNATTPGGTSGNVTYTYTTAPPGYTTTLYSPADTFVQSNSSTKNFGTTNIVVQNNASLECAGYIKFDLNTVQGTTITSAKLHLCQSTNWASTTQQIFSCATDSWTETGLTWKTSQSTYPWGTEQASFTTPSAQYLWSTIDVTSYVNANFNGDKLVTMVVRDKAKLNKIVQYYSDETGASGGYRPYLAVVSQ